MNYGKLTAGTTKTAIDTAKPSEKGEIITYLSRMGDVLEPVLDACHVAVGAVGVNGVEVVVDGNIPHAVLRKRVVDIKPCQRGITTKPTEVFRNHRFHMTGFNFRKHLLKAGAVGKIHTAVPVINEECRVRKVLRFCILH